jgi:hypothetical protein
MTTTEILRKEVKKYINTADENSLRRVRAILEIDQNSNDWWKDKQFIKELDRMNEAMESGADKGVTFEDIEASIEARRLEIYGA